MSEYRAVSIYTEHVLIDEPVLWGKLMYIMSKPPVQSRVVGEKLKYQDMMLGAHYQFLLHSFISPI